MDDRQKVSMGDLMQQVTAREYVESLNRRERRKLERKLRVSKGARRGSYASKRTVKRAQDGE